MAKWASKDHTITGLKFVDKYGIEYKFDEKEDTIIEERPIDIALYPNVPAEAPGIMTQLMGEKKLKTSQFRATKNKQCWRQKIPGFNLDP